MQRAKGIVAGEKLIAAIAAQRDRNILPRETGEQNHRQERSVAQRFAELGNNIREQGRGPVEIERLVVMPGAERFRHQASEAGFIEARRSESDGEGVQLTRWNVLRGEMGFVGPRPERPEFVQWLASEIPFYELRHMIRPGITGWAQVRYQYGASLEETRQKLEYDLYYVKHLSVGLDLLIMFETIKTIILRRGAQ